MTKYPGIKKIQKAFDLAADVPMRQYTRFKVGGPAELLALPRTRQELVAILKTAKDESVPVTIVGGGCNLLVPDQGIRGLVLVTTRLTSGILADKKTDQKTRLSMDAGERLSTVCRYTVTHGLSGLEFCAGIPGTMGGAVMMNAGTATQGIGSCIHCLEVLNLDTLMVTLLKKQHLVFTYRCLELTNHLILGIHLELTSMNPDQVKNNFDAHLKHKQKTQPMDLPSAGCFFKNPRPNLPAGKLIEDAGLKGEAVRDAQVSPIHANYIVNRGHATCQDILDLKARIQKTVFTRYGITLETEVRLTGKREKTR
ncbi:MAG: UDP-N-acetylmuramate dehydrogenase [Desulfotignum sp.]|nr:UDP-N-acetylmuramate dehydrogenase [Desulfotignum sp.]